MNDPKIMAALITACVSILAAIISYFKSYFSSKKSVELAKEIEALKHDFSIESETLKHNFNKDTETLKNDLNKDIEALKHNLNLEREAMEEKKKINKEQLSALSDSVKSIQKVKDVIQLIVDSYERSHHSKVAIKNIGAASKELISSYKENLTKLLEGGHPNEQKLFHDAKKLIIHIESFIISALDQKIYTSDLSTKEKTKLREWRSDLSEIQTQLQNSLCEQFIRCSMNNVENGKKINNKQAIKQERQDVSVFEENAISRR
jgi:hypothetical protein